jgi:Zn-finger nucleic acid-binding protein/ribosomal protein L40E
VRLVACTNCHTQYDVTDVVDAEISCRCGVKIDNTPLEGRDAAVHRCGSCGAQLSGDAEGCGYCGAEIVQPDAELSLICPECYGRNAEAARYCVGCGVAFSPQQVEQEQHEIPCPCCGCLMPTRMIGGVGINECPQCNGLWVPENRFDHLIAKACEAAMGKRGLQARIHGARVSGGNPVGTRVVYRKCPICEAHMQRRNFRKRSGVIIDRCHSHGTWLDADELERIAGFILEGGMGAEGAHAYRLRTELDATKRRNADALTRAVRGESITIDIDRDQGFGGTLMGVLSALLK